MVASISHAISEPGGSRNFLLTQYNMDRIIQFVSATIQSAICNMSNAYMPIYVC